MLVVVVLFGGGVARAVVQSLGMVPGGGSRELSLDAYRAVLASTAFRRGLFLTLWVSLASTLLTVVLGVATALGLRRTRLGRRAAMLVYQFPLTVPHIVVAAGMIALLSQSGLVARAAFALGLIGEPVEFPALIGDRFGFGIILVYLWKQIPFIGLMALAVLRTVGEDYEDAARTLGAGSWQRIWRVLVPLTAPAIVPGSIIIFAFAFGSFEVPLLLGRSFPTMLSVVAYRLYIDTRLALRPQAMALSVIITLLVLLLVLLYQRFVRPREGARR